VRIHTDEHAERSARAIHAVAYTAGSHVVFGAGSYHPGSEEGRRLIAHELTHLRQQASAGTPSGRIPVGPGDDPVERKAEAAAASLALPQTSAPAPAPLPARHNWSRLGTTTGTILWRRLIVDPPAALDQIEEDFHDICPRQVPTVSPETDIQSHCPAGQNAGCSCLWDVTADPKRDFTVQLLPATVGYGIKKRVTKCQLTKRSDPTYGM
jgi:hypothetical protein